jgi:hypothetical protein
MNILSTAHAAGRSAPRDTTASASMVPPVPTPSARLVRAAAAERTDIARHRDRLLGVRDRLHAELADLEAALRELDERDALLDRLAGRGAPVTGSPADAAEGATRDTRLRADGAGGATVAAAGGRPRDIRAAGPAAALDDGTRRDRTVLRGPAIRRTAVEILRALPERPLALHYRAWFDALRAAGFDVAGKDPLAVFLTQLSRSPAVRRGTQSGVYELDPDAPRRLRARLDALHSELRGLTATPSPTTDLTAIRARRAAITTRITRVEKALEEAEAVLAPAAERRRAASA